MNIKLSLLGLVGLVGGCASTGVGPERTGADFSGFTHRGTPSMLVGDARVVDARVNPLIPVQASAEGNEVTLRFGRRRHVAGVVRLEASPFELLSLGEPAADGDAPSTPQASRVVLDGGHFMVCWKRGDAESGYRAVAQVYTQDGTPLGSPSVISPPEVDVVGSPQMVTTDGRHVLATFAVAANGSFELLAVPVADITDGDPAPATARR